MKVIKPLLLLSLTFISLLLASPSMAEVMLHGMIRDKYPTKYGYPSYYDFSDYSGKNNYFPKNHYSYTIYAFDLKYDDSVSTENRKYDLNDYTGNIKANLDLVSSNNETKTYTYRLSMKLPYLKYIGPANDYRWMQGGADFSGKVKLSDGSPTDFLIEVKVGKDEKGKPILINSKNNKYFKLEFIYPGSLRPDLIRPYDLPVIIEGTYPDYMR